MRKHSHFDIWLHDDDELSAIHGAKVASRAVLRQWPLSVVERLEFADGASRIYKAYYNLPVESEFYRNVRSRHIPAMFYSCLEGDRHWLLLEDIEGRHPAGLDFTGTVRLFRATREIIDNIETIKCVRHDLTARNYELFVRSIIDLLITLNGERKLKKTDREAIGRINNALSHPEALRFINDKRSIIHGDMKCDNILVRPNGEIAIIDWQNITIGPPEVDLYSLLATRGIDPVPHAGIGPEILRLALEIRWFADCLNRWIPYPDFLDGQISTVESYLASLVKHNGYTETGVYYFH